MKDQFTDKELLRELKRRFDENKAILEEERALFSQLSDVNEKLLESEHLKSNFLSNIRNEINNPIASILELSKNIYEGNLNEKSIKKFASLIFSEAFDLEFQLKNVFLSAEIEAGESPLSVISVNINSLLINVIDSFRPKLEKKEIIFNFHNSIEDHLIFKTDSEKLHLILSNLFSNAIQFNHQGGNIDVYSSIENEQLVIVIKDSGIGISNKNKEKIYNRFHQIEEGSTKTYGGHGLGLSITKALLEIIEGDISLESKLGEGTSFCVRIKNLGGSDASNHVYSADGNDFLFDQDDDDDDMLF